MRSVPSTSAGKIALAALVLATVTAGTDARAQDLQQRIGEAEQELEKVQSREGVLTREIDALSERISALETRVGELRNREALLALELTSTQSELESARARLQVVRARLRAALRILEARLVAIYKTGEPDLLTVVLESDGFADLVARSEYLQRIEQRDAEIVWRVRDLRNEMRATVAQIRAARDSLVQRRRELESTRAALESEGAALSGARGARERLLAGVRERRGELEGDLSQLSRQVERQLAESPSTPLPAGPIRGGSEDMIWPVDGMLTSTFGMRWGRMHEGIDIAAPGGTPIRAASAGTIEFASYNGGYGNYTCIDHGGSLSTCYAHQQGFARTSGSVGQGTVIGYVGTTGHSTGNHLHFEVRINGEAVDPLGYL